MRKLRLKVSDNASFELNLPFLGGAKQKGSTTQATFGRQSILEFTNKFGGWIITAITTLFGFGYLWLGEPTSEVPYLFLAAMFVVLAAVLICLALAGWRYLVDPPLFVHVLIFALIVIATFLFVPMPARLGAKYVGANTFGIEGAQYLSGLYIMGFIGLFYFTHLLLNTREKLNSLAVSVLTGLSLATALSVFSDITAAHLGLLIVIALPVLFNYLILGGRKWLGIVCLVGLGIALVLFFKNPVVTLGMILAVLSGFVITLLLILKSQNWELRSPLGNLVNGVRKYIDSDLRLIELAKQNGLILTIVALGLWFVLTIAWVIANRVELGTAIQDLISVYSYLGVMVGDWPAWLLGRGVTLDPRATTLATIILYQGALGVVAYLIIGATALFATVKAVGKEFKEDYGSQYALILAPIVVMIPVLAIFELLSFIVVALWWLAFSYMAVSASTKENLALKVVDRLKLWRLSLEKHLTWIQFVLIGVIIIATIYFIPLLRGQLV